MSEPLDLEAIRERAAGLATWVENYDRLTLSIAAAHRLEQLRAQDVPALLAEVDGLRALLADRQESLHHDGYGVHNGTTFRECRSGDCREVREAIGE